MTNLFALESIAELDRVCFQGKRARLLVHFDEEPARIAENGAIFVSAPARRNASAAVMANRLLETQVSNRLSVVQIEKAVAVRG